MTEENVWHALDVQDVFKKIETSARGLSNAEAKKRLGQCARARRLRGR